MNCDTSVLASTLGIRLPLQSHPLQALVSELLEPVHPTVVMSNHTEFDRAYDRVRLAQLPRAQGEKHPYETDVQTVQRYFEMTGACAEAQRLLMN